MNFQPKKQLLTLSDFVTQLEEETNNFMASDAIEIIEYNNFLKQELKDKIIEDVGLHFISKRSTFETLKKFQPKTFQELAELAKKEGFEVYIKA